MRLGLRRGEFHLLYQPQMSADGKRIVAVEALARWRHPELGSVGPIDFVGVAEREGMIAPLGEFLLRQACHDGKGWPEVAVSVNLSGLQLSSADFPDVVKSIAAEQGFALDRLELEITESAVADNFDRVTGNMAALRAAGVRFALDDYGLGRARPEDLRRLPLDKVKIDKSVVAEIESERSTSIIRGLLALAREIGLKVSAEGVETEAQHAFLRECGCNIMQGYLFSRPVEAQAISGLLAQEPQ